MMYWVTTALAPALMALLSSYPLTGDLIPCPQWMWWDKARDLHPKGRFWIHSSHQDGTYCPGCHHGLGQACHTWEQNEGDNGSSGEHGGT